ncbi:MAG: rod shape-determining protein MreD [Candidatus Omnitrophica bacterium]|nr:rod shape-determining protein MreD [Candidatus Omnitrophota bacterium]
MKKIIFLCFILGLAILEESFLSDFRIFGVSADMLLIALVVSSLFFRFGWALVFSIFAGLLRDCFSNNVFGFNMILFAFLSLLIIRISREIPIESAFLRIILVFIITFLYILISGIIFISLGRFIPLGIFLHKLFLAPIFTAAVSWIIFKLSESINLKC